MLFAILLNEATDYFISNPRINTSSKKLSWKLPSLCNKINNFKINSLKTKVGNHEMKLQVFGKIRLINGNDKPYTASLGLLIATYISSYYNITFASQFATLLVQSILLPR